MGPSAASTPCIDFSTLVHPIAQCDRVQPIAQHICLCSKLDSFLSHRRAEMVRISVP
jgi:hypothetical protein